MNRRITAVVLGVLVAGAACSKSNNRPADTSLNSDLSLAAQQRGAQLDSLSPAERSNLAATPAPVSTSPRTVASTRSSSGEVSHTARRVRRSSSGGSSSSSSSGSVGTTTTTTSSGHVEKHTQRDAAIGAAAGAVIGATTSRNKVKGGLIGAAVGGILGGVIGNNVDKKKVP